MTVAGPLRTICRGTQRARQGNFREDTRLGGTSVLEFLLSILSLKVLPCPRLFCRVQLRRL